MLELFVCFVLFIHVFFFFFGLFILNSFKKDTHIQIVETYIVRYTYLCLKQNQHRWLTSKEWALNEEHNYELLSWKVLKIFCRWWWPNVKSINLDNYMFASFFFLLYVPLIWRKKFYFLLSLIGIDSIFTRG